MKKLLILLALALTACSQNDLNHHYIEGEAFGTTYHIQFFEGEKSEIHKGVDSIVAAVNRSVSTYIPTSDISKINRGDTTVVVDDIFKEAYYISKEVNQTTYGYFDPTIGVLRNAYGFGDAKPLEKLDAHVLDSLMQYVGFGKVNLNKDGTISKDLPQIYFDFNAVAKGSGIDEIGSYLESEGIKDYLIELGGEILAKGKNIKKNHDWVVGIETPDSELYNRTYEATVRLKNSALAASGNYRKFRIDSVTGKKYVHTLNPLTGSAQMSDVTSATVIAPTCGEADAYATSFMALGIEKSKEVIEKVPELEVYLTYLDSTGSEAVFISEGFRRLMED